MTKHKKLPQNSSAVTLAEKGFARQSGVYSLAEVATLNAAIDALPLRSAYGEREFLLRYPQLWDKLLTPNLLKLIRTVSPSAGQLVKSIFFDKPPSANWSVPWHQDLIISVKEQRETAGFSHWQVRKNRIVVQPPAEVLANIVTLRIHLDDCTADNGALRVIEASHHRGIVPMNDWQPAENDRESLCQAQAGDVMLMQPLTLHSSKRTSNQQRRRVVHLEFFDGELPNGLQWKEGVTLPNTPNTSPDRLI